MLPWEAAPFPPLLTRIPAPRGLSSAFSGDCLAQGHTLLLQRWDLTWVRWFGLEHHHPTPFSLARQRQVISHQRLPGTLNHPAPKLGPTGLG